MRLLNVHTLQLETFYGESIPEYSILSHTWRDEEVLLQDLETDTNHTKKGWAKINACCKLAADSGFKYTWIDTCCIDKKDSVELSEAILSMFRWHQDSKMCYAFLDDVTGPEGVEWQDCRWFTRGWTLQELLAPRSLLFFNRDWERLGSREELSEKISALTNISRRHLIDEPDLPNSTSRFERVCVGEKMYWASGRRTTRVEDETYSLLGLFGIHMPLLYGEGRAAFYRFQRELLNHSDDETLLTHVSNHVLAESARDFILPSLGKHLRRSGISDESISFRPPQGGVFPIRHQRASRHRFILQKRTLQITGKVWKNPDNRDYVICFDTEASHSMIWFLQCSTGKTFRKMGIAIASKEMLDRCFNSVEEDICEIQLTWDNGPSMPRFQLAVINWPLEVPFERYPEEDKAILHADKGLSHLIWTSGDGTGRGGYSGYFTAPHFESVRYTCGFDLTLIYQAKLQLLTNSTPEEAATGLLAFGTATWLLALEAPNGEWYPFSFCASPRRSQPPAKNTRITFTAMVVFTNNHSAASADGPQDTLRQALETNAYNLYNVIMDVKEDALRPKSPGIEGFKSVLAENKIVCEVNWADSKCPRIERMAYGTRQLKFPRRGTPRHLCHDILSRYFWEPEWSVFHQRKKTRYDGKWRHVS